MLPKKGDWVQKNVPWGLGSHVYYVPEDRRCTKPKKYVVLGYWITVEEGLNSVSLAEFDKGKFVSSRSVNYMEHSERLFCNLDEAIEYMERGGR